MNLEQPVSPGKNISVRHMPSVKSAHKDLVESAHIDPVESAHKDPVKSAHKDSVKSAHMNLSDCTLCPRDCHVDRLRGGRGFCGEAGTLRAARAALYFNEEPVISGQRGSGTVFFTGCNLGCIYCQNRQISRPGLPEGHGRAGTSAVTSTIGVPSPPAAGAGISGMAAPAAALPAPRIPSASAAAFPASEYDIPVPSLLELSPERLCEIFFELEAQGAHNINLVTAEHFVPLLLPALARAKDQGLSIPVVYNTGSYERVESVRALEGLVDIWMPDLKYLSPALSKRHLGVSDYFRYASAAIAEMVRQCPEPLFADGSHAIDCPDDADDPLMVRGVLVRHLALPGCGEDSRAVLRWLHKTFGESIFISILNQYTPMPQLSDSQYSSWPDRPGIEPIDPNLFRRLTQEEYDALVDYAVGIGITNGFIQEGGTVSRSYIPTFDGTGILTPSAPGTSCSR